ncbi:MAG: AAA family ATPase [Frankiaceae bacterium]|nr:AAA family ATPase [Frankiaceae bacterium]
MESSALTELETHVSRLFLTDELVVKVKKALRTDFLDFTTPALREQACCREVELNRRLAPDVYLGVAHLPSAQDAWEPAVVMRRQPNDWNLERLALSGADLTSAVEAVSARLADFHRGADRSVHIDGSACPAAVLRRWQRNAGEIRQARPSYVDLTRLGHVDALAVRYLTGREALLRRRIASGRICDGHGDPLAADIFCPPGQPPVILDCLEFDDELRYGDVLADVAFLAMDLERCGRPEAAGDLLTAYQRVARDTWPASLADYYIAYRAMIRAKVAGLRVAQGDVSARGLVEDHLAVAERHLHAGAARLVLVGGLPGTGKSTLSRELASRLGWTYLSSDVQRKELIGVPVDRRLGAAFGEGMYDDAGRDRTYRALLATAGEALSLGESVIIDATWAATSHRDQAALTAGWAVAELICLQTVLPDEEADARLVRRSELDDDASDADVAVARELRSRFDPWSAHRVDTSGSASPAVDEAIRLVAASVSRPGA